MNATGRRVSESRVRENLMHGLMWWVMETGSTALFPDPIVKCPDSGKLTANGKVVHREMKSERKPDGKPLVGRTEITYKA